MQRLGVNKKSGEYTLSVDSLEDLWYLYQIIEPGDVLHGKTIRKIKIEGGGERTAAVLKKIIHLHITVEKLELSDTELRVSGKTLQGTDDVPSGSYHTFALEPGETFTLQKKHWLTFHLEKLDEACMPTHNPILLVIHDRETALFALLKKTGVETLTTLQGQVAKKGMDQPTKDFFKEIAKHLHDYYERYKPESVVLASPAFFKEYVHKELDVALHSKVILATVHSVGQNGVHELLHRDEIKTAIAHDRNVREMKKVELLAMEIAKEGNAAYGLIETTQAADAGAVKELLLTDKLLRTKHEEGTYSELDSLLKKVDKTGGKIFIISSAHDGGKQLDGLGGVGALLRFRVS